MQSTTSTRVRTVTVAAAALAVALVAAIAFVASGALGRAADPSPSPSGPAVGSPSPEPSVSPEPSEEPTLGPVDLENETDQDVVVVIDDQTGEVVSVGSGKPGDGMSVRWFDAIVENVDDTTVQVTWVGLPVDGEVELTILAYEGGYRFHFDGPNPPLYSDAIGFDRVLVVQFDQLVSADQVMVTFEGAPDNEG